MLPIYFYIDAARSSNEAELVKATSSIAEGFDHPNKHIIYRDVNLGLKESLTDGISQVLEYHDAVIVLEDDLVVGSFALEYFLSGLEKYAHNPKVVSICGYAVGEFDNRSAHGAHFLPMTHPWGWATWRDRWHEHMTGTAGNASMQSASFRVAMNVFGLRDYRSMLGLAKRELISSWWIHWQLNAVNRHSVSLFPQQSHISNTGLRTGTHASGWNILMKLQPNKTLAQTSTNFPDEIILDFEALDYIITSRESLILRITGYLGKMKRTIKRNIK